MSKVVYQSIKVEYCNCCKTKTKHVLIDYTNQVYKCAMCRNINKK